MHKRKVFVYILVIIAMLVWGASFIWTKIALEHYQVYTIVFIRLLISTILLFPILFAMKKIKIPQKNEWILFILLALFEPFLYYMGEANGLRYVSPSMASIIIAIIPLFTPLVAFVFLKEKISYIHIIGILVSILGIFIMVIDADFNLQISIKGLLLLFLSIFAANGYSVMINKIPDRHSIFNIIFWQNLIGAFMFLPLMLIFTPEDLTMSKFNMEALLAICQLGIFASTIAFLFYMYGLKFMPITKINVFTNLIPIFTFLIAFFFFNESIDIKKVIGICIVIAGVTITQLVNKNAKNKT